MAPPRGCMQDCAGGLSGLAASGSSNLQGGTLRGGYTHTKVPRFDLSPGAIARGLGMRRVRAVRVLIDRSAMCETDARDGARSQSTMKLFIEGLLDASSWNSHVQRRAVETPAPRSEVIKSERPKLGRRDSESICHLSGFSYVCLCTVASREKPRRVVLHNRVVLPRPVRLGHRVLELIETNRAWAGEQRALS